MLSEAFTRRIQAVLLLALVLSVPALTRATQHLSSIASGQEPSGFSTSADSAPERVTIPADVYVIAPVSSIIVAPPRSVLLARSADERLPLPPVIAAARPLRAPPSSVFVS
jgi:hypothetical protein